MRNYRSHIKTTVWPLLTTATANWYTVICLFSFTKFSCDFIFGRVSPSENISRPKFSRDVHARAARTTVVGVYSSSRANMRVGPRSRDSSAMAELDISSCVCGHHVIQSWMPSINWRKFDVLNIRTEKFSYWKWQIFGQCSPSENISTAKKRQITILCCGSLFLMSTLLKCKAPKRPWYPSQKTLSEQWYCQVVADKLYFLRRWMSRLRVKGQEQSQCGSITKLSGSCLFDKMVENRMVCLQSWSAIKMSEGAYKAGRNAVRCSTLLKNKRQSKTSTSQTLAVTYV